MDERVTLRSHLESTSQPPHGAAVGEVIEAIAAAAVDLAALIADGPLAGNRTCTPKASHCRCRRATIW